MITMETPICPVCKKQTIHCYLRYENQKWWHQCDRKHGLYIYNGEIHEWSDIIEFNEDGHIKINNGLVTLTQSCYVSIPDYKNFQESKPIRSKIKVITQPICPVCKNNTNVRGFKYQTGPLEFWHQCSGKHNFLLFCGNTTDK